MPPLFSFKVKEGLQDLDFPPSHSIHEKFFFFRGSDGAESDDGNHLLNTIGGYNRNHFSTSGDREIEQSRWASDPEFGLFHKTIDWLLDRCAEGLK